MKKAIIGIDQSYTDTGIAIAVNGVIQTAFSVYLKGCKHDTERRMILQKRLVDCINFCEKHNYDPDVYFEQIRISGQQTTFNYIVRAGSMVATIVDTCYQYNADCYSVTPNAWKTSILGSTKSKVIGMGVDPKKALMYEYCVKKGYDKYVLQPANKRTRNYIKLDIDNQTKLKYNDNIGDSIGIALYGSKPENEQKKEKCI